MRRRHEHGIAAFGVGPLEESAGLSLNTIYSLAAAVALAMAALSFIVVRRSIKPTLGTNTQEAH